MIAEPAGFETLSKADQIRYVQDLWDRIIDSPGDVPVRESHVQLAASRLSAFRLDPTHARPATEVIDRLSSKAR